jgi:hypothetical protein
VTVEGERVVSVLGGLMSTVWRPAGAEQEVAVFRFLLTPPPFEVPEAASAVTFHTDPAGPVTGLTWHQGGADFEASRLPDDEAPLDLAPYQGRYYSAEFETYYTVTAGADHLVVDHRRRDPITLKHGHGDAFDGGFPLVQVEFERDQDGDVIAFRAGNIRTRDVRFERVR